jgi:hypothetical protein
MLQTTKPIKAKGKPGPKSVGTTPPIRKGKQAASFLDPAKIATRFYSLLLKGHCLNPVFRDGDKVIVDKEGPLDGGCYAVFYYRPEIVPSGELPMQLKRLVTAMPPHLTLPFREHPKSELRFVIAVEQLNPAKRWMVFCEDLLAVHHCIGRADDPDVQAKLAAEGWVIPEGRRI